MCCLPYSKLKSNFTFQTEAFFPFRLLKSVQLRTHVTILTFEALWVEILDRMLVKKRLKFTCIVSSEFRSSVTVYAFVTLNLSYAALTYRQRLLTISVLSLICIISLLSFCLPIFIFSCFFFQSGYSFVFGAKNESD